MSIKNTVAENHIIKIAEKDELTNFSLSSRPTSYREKYREYLCELFATFVFVTIGTGSIAQGVTNSDSGLIGSIGYGVGLTVAVMLSLNVSGGHVSPAITLSLACFRSFPMHKVPGYMFCQFIGALLGAFLVFLTNYSKIINMETAAIASIFTTTPTTHLFMVFLTEIFGTAFLLIGVQAAADQKNVPKWFFPNAVGILLVGLGLAFPGIAFNPAIDLSGRIMASIIGNSPLPFTEYTGYFIIPLIAPLLGANLGIAAYDFMVVNLPSS